MKSFISDNRLKYYKTDEVVGVTANWNNALRASSGEYVLMIGDDDYLLPGYFDHINSIIEKNNNPDAVSYCGFLFIFPDPVSLNLFYELDFVFIFGFLLIYLFAFAKTYQFYLHGKRMVQLC